MRLLPKDFDALQRAILDLHELRSVAAFRQALPRIALQIIPTNYSAWNQFMIAGTPKMTDCMESSPRVTPQFIANAERNIFSHPFTKYFMRTGDVTALKLSDFLTQKQMRSCSMWEEMVKPLQTRYHLTVSLAGSMTKVSALSVSSASRDFTERDRLMLNLLRPHIIQAGRTAELFDQLANGKILAGPDQLRDAFNFSPRECEVAHWVAEGKTNPEIATILNARPRTIEKHLERILQKMGVENRTAAAATLLKNDFLSRRAFQARRA